MKAKLFLAAMLLMVGANVMADEYQYLTITYSDTERSISLPIIQKISFADDYVVVTTTEGVHKYPISLLDKITFTENATAIKDLPEQAKDLTFKDGSEKRVDFLSREFSSWLKLPHIGPYTPAVDKVADQYIRQIRLMLPRDKALQSNKKQLLDSVNAFEKEKKYFGHMFLDVDPV